MTYQYSGNLTVGQWQVFVRMIQFLVNNDEPSDHMRQLEFSIGVDDQFSVPVFTYVNVTLVSDNCPVLALSGTMLLYTEHSSSVVLDASLNVTDPDLSAVLQSAQVRVSSSSPCPFCTLEATVLTPSISQNFTDGVLTLTGPATSAKFQNAPRSVEFEDTGDELPASLITIEYTLFDPTQFFFALRQRVI